MNPGRIGRRAPHRLDARAIILVAVLSALFGSAFTLPHLAHGDCGILRGVAIALAIAVVQTLVFSGAIMVIRAVFQRRPLRDAPTFEDNRRFAIAAFAILWGTALFSLLSAYAGYCSVDSRDVFEQAAGRYQYSDHWRYEGLSNHHPILYTMLFRLVYMLTSSASEHVTVFVFLAIQSCICSACLAWVLSWMNSKGKAHRAITVLALLAFAFVPVYAVHEITLWKDAMFSSVLLVFAFKLHGVCRFEEERRKADFVALAAIAMFVALLRNNGIYIVICSMAFCLVACKGMRRPLAGSLAGALAVILSIQNPLFNMAGIEKSHFSESTGVAFQQIALIVKEDGIGADGEAFLSNIVDVETMKESYVAHSFDKIKFNPGFDDSYLEAHKPEFLLLWARAVSAHPRTAMKAWVLQTEDIWRPGSVAEISTKLTIDNSLPIDKIGLGWKPREAFNKVEYALPYVFGKGAAIWIVAWISLLSVLIRPDERAKAFVVFVPGVALFATMMLATPSSWDYRYIYYFTLLIPTLPFFVADACKSVPRLDGLHE
jgi:hypothetical protein